MHALPFSFERTISIHVEGVVVLPLDAEFPFELVPVFFDSSEELLLEISVIDSVSELVNDFIGNHGQI